MPESSKPKPRPPMDEVGKLLTAGKDIATYLFQVPDDESQRERLRAILASIETETKGGNHRELPRIASEVAATLSEPPSIPAAEMVQAGFDRMWRLWESARSGLF